MAVIEKRKTQDGKTHYRVKVRLKGYPPQTSTHERLADAKDGLLIRKPLFEKEGILKQQKLKSIR